MIFEGVLRVAWRPSFEIINSAGLAKLCEFHGDPRSGYSELCRWPENFDAGFHFFCRRMTRVEKSGIKSS